MSADINMEVHLVQLCSCSFGEPRPGLAEPRTCIFLVTASAYTIFMPENWISLQCSSVQNKIKLAPLVIIIVLDLIGALGPDSLECSGAPFGFTLARNL